MKFKICKYITIGLMKHFFAFSIWVFMSCQMHNEQCEDNKFPEITDIPPCYKDERYLVDGGYTVKKVLKDEPATIYKQSALMTFINEDGFNNHEISERFIFVLGNEISISDFMTFRQMMPCGDLPEQFRIEGLSVYISGNVIDGRAVTAAPYNTDGFRRPRWPIFELTSIKINNNK
ncbi:MAG: hypothetical protein LBE56_05685 [Tannerella sp.]|jgi:hypothetical protein|nr:hypothetical protein [Tannerella sp.]